MKYSCPSIVGNMETHFEGELCGGFPKQGWITIKTTNNPQFELGL